MVELTEKGTEELTALRTEYKVRTGKAITDSEMADRMIQMSYNNPIGVWL